MTANHAHTPTMDQIRDDFIEAWSGHFMDGDKGAAEYFDQALRTHNATIEAAAEQRGAIKALRDAAESPDLIGHMYREYDEHPLRSTLAPAAVRATATYLHNRADQEGDDGQS